MGILNHLERVVLTGTPLVAINTPDAYALSYGIAAWAQRAGNGIAAVHWDCARGLLPLNARAEAMQLPKGNMANAPDFLKALATPDAPRGTLYLAHNLQAFFGVPMVTQAIANLREYLKTQSQSHLIMLATDMTLPSMLQHDVVVFHEPFPGADVLSGIVKEQYSNAGLAEPDEQTLIRAVDAVRGLAAFSAEQETAMCLRADGLDIDALWERKRIVIEQTKGLSVWRGTETFETTGGCSQIIQFFRDLKAGREAPRAIVWIDEVADAMAGQGGDLTGVSQDVHGTLIEHMENRHADGVILFGVSGSGKSQIAKASGHLFGVPTIRFDVGACFEGLVGKTGENVRRALKIIDSVSDGSALYIATSNSTRGLTPQFKRRYTYGVWMFDLPDSNERAAIWRIHLGMHGLTPSTQDMPDDTDWTGSDIATCCRLAYKLKQTPKYASQYLVPVAESSIEAIDEMRREAHMHYKSASHPGKYNMRRSEAENMPSNGTSASKRHIRLKHEEG